MKIEEKFVETKIGKICYLEAGKSNKTLVFLHGWGDVTHQVKYFIPALDKAGYRVIAPTLPGHGNSFAISKKFTFNDAVETLIEFLNKTCPDTFSMFGVSLGGGLACEISKRLGDRVEKIILEAPLLKPISGKDIIKTGAGLAIDAVKDAKRKRSWEPSILPKSISNKSPSLNLMNALGMVNTVTPINFPIGKQKLLFLLGEYDHVVSLNTHLLSKYGDVKLFPSGHHFSLSQPEGFIEEIIKFLKS